MPIANCFIKETQVSQKEIQSLAKEWAKQVNVDVKDICLTFIPNCVQGGQQYNILINLYLPSLWPDEKVKDIQKCLLTILSNHFRLEPSKIFIITSIIKSGHVVDNGDIVEW